MDLGLEVTKRERSVVVTVSGEVDVATAPRLRSQLVSLVGDGERRIICDLEGVDFLDSTGLGVLVGVLKRVRTHGGELIMVCTQRRLLKVFEITGLTRVFEFFDTVDEAVAAG
jgi:anti-sigma B factor antagonist